MVRLKYALTDVWIEASLIYHGEVRLLVLLLLLDELVHGFHLFFHNALIKNGVEEGLYFSAYLFYVVTEEVCLRLRLGFKFKSFHLLSEVINLSIFLFKRSIFRELRNKSQNSRSSSQLGSPASLTNSFDILFGVYFGPLFWHFRY